MRKLLPRPLPPRLLYEKKSKVENDLLPQLCFVLSTCFLFKQNPKEEKVLSESIRTKTGPYAEQPWARLYRSRCDGATHVDVHMISRFDRKFTHRVPLVVHLFPATERMSNRCFFTMGVDGNDVRWCVYARFRERPDAVGPHKNVDKARRGARIRGRRVK